jgi:hypothetical protein
MTQGWVLLAKLIGETMSLNRRIFAVRYLAILMATVLLATGVVFLFQNCSQPLTSNTNDSLQALAEKQSFAYDATIDQLSYMSCSNVVASPENGSAYYTIRAGAYYSGGLRLDPTYRNSMTMTPMNRMVELLTSAPQNTGTVLQMAVRPKGLLQNIQMHSGQTPVAGVDYVNLLAPLGGQDVSEILLGLSPGVRINRIRDGSITGTRLAGDLQFNSAYGVESGLRGAMSKSMLTLTYTNGGANATNDVTARAPSDLPTATASPSSTTALPNTQYVFGRGYVINFSLPSVGYALPNGYPANVISPDASGTTGSGVREVNLANPLDTTSIGQWTCPVSMQFRIIRAADLGTAGVNCNVKPDPALMPADLAIVRKSLPVEDWYVDMANHCIIEKTHGTGCYGTASKVVYTTDACYTDVTNPGTASGICVAYASVCYRVN